MSTCVTFILGLYTRILKGQDSAHDLNHNICLIREVTSIRHNERPEQRAGDQPGDNEAASTPGQISEPGQSPNPNAQSD